MRNNYKRIFVTPNNLHGFIRARIFHAEQSLHSDRIPTKYGRDTRFPKRISHEKQTNKQAKFEIKREDKNNKKLTKQQQKKKKEIRDNVNKCIFIADFIIKYNFSSLIFVKKNPS